MNLPDPTLRFSDRVDDYVKYRPGYPPAVLSFFKTKLNLKPKHSIADIGSGTGIFTKILLENGNTVFAVEPNAAMRLSAEKNLRHYKTFISIGYSAENTSLPNNTVDFIVAAQAFHWFDTTATRREWVRILKPKGYVVLIWNDRQTYGTPFLEEYEALLHRFGTDYAKVQHRTISSQSVLLENFFNHKKEIFYNEQILDFEGVLGRLSSCSYIPKPQNPIYPEMIKTFKNLFHKYSKAGLVTLAYDTVVIWGQI